MVYGSQIKKELEEFGVKILNFGELLNKNSAIRDNQYYNVLRFSDDEVI